MVLKASAAETAKSLMNYKKQLNTPIAHPFHLAQVICVLLLSPQHNNPLPAAAAPVLGSIVMPMLQVLYVPQVSPCCFLDRIVMLFP
jgi:hypothetical protein